MHAGVSNLQNALFASDTFQMPTCIWHGLSLIYLVCVCVCVYVYVCVYTHVCVCARVRACVCAYTRTYTHTHTHTHMLREQAIEANPVLLDTQLVNPKLFAGKLVVCRLGKCAAAAKALRAAQASASGALGINSLGSREQFSWNILYS